jgi:hypothetical protein
LLLVSSGDKGRCGARRLEVIATPDQERCRLIAGHVATDYARDKVAMALYEAVVEGLDFGPSDLPRPEDRDWIRGHIALPLREATAAALQVLATSVSRELEHAPIGLLERYEESHRLEELGFE